MILDDLRQQYFVQDSTIKFLAKRLGDGKGQHFVLKGLCVSARQMALLSIQQDKNMLVIMGDAESAKECFEDCITLSLNALYFPSSYRKKKLFDEMMALERNRTLSTLITQPNIPYIIVTYPQALLEYVPNKKSLQDDILVLHTGEHITISTLTEQLIQRHYVQVDFVYEPGQFAVRGGIVDIFSYDFAYPFRIDFFGDDIDSVRLFDIETQLSRRKIDECRIISNPTLQAQQTHSTLMDYVDESITLVSDDFQTIDFQLGKNMDMEQYNTLEFKDTSETFKEQQVVTFSFLPQPIFHKDFELLTDDLISKQRDGYKIFLLCEQPKQQERLKSIFESYPNKEPIVFEPVEQTLHHGFIDTKNKICCYTDHEIFERYHRVPLYTENVRKGKALITLKEINQLQVGDYVVHTIHGIGKFGGLVRTPVNGRMQEMIKLIYRDGDTVFVSIHNLHRISKYKGKDGIEPTISKIGSSVWEKKKEHTKERLKALARDLIALYAERKKQKGFAFSEDSYLQKALEASFIYEDTPDQVKATTDVKHDMESEKPMDRLICGDVGFGKTEVAMRATFKAVGDNKQVAILVPTTVLALQHYKTFTERFKDYPITIDYFSRGKNVKETKDILERLKAGKIDVLIGTHKIVGKSVEWKDLGLLIVDEEQKFGVAIKDKIKALKTNIDVLTLTATPIPRTLQFSLLGARDLSVMTTPPPNRFPIVTETITNADEDVIQEAIQAEMQRNGQVFAVTNRIEFIPTITRQLQRLCPKARIVTAHGQMPPDELEKRLEDFINYDYDILISTTIIESGIDMPNVNTMLIYSAQRFGLATLHQLRGRVGRSNRKAYCYLIAPPMEELNADAKRRLTAVETFSELGSGFSIAMQDLDIRGAGNLLGAEQSGFIAELGYETYQQILNEAVGELKKGEFYDLFKDTKEQDDTVWATDCTLETDLDIGFPMDYIENVSERIALYRELDTLRNEDELKAYTQRLTDRFGKPNEQVEELFNTIRLRWLCCKLGIEKVFLKKERMTIYFTRTAEHYWQSDEFGKILAYITSKPQRCLLKQEGENRYAIISDVRTVAGATTLLSKILMVD